MNYNTSYCVYIVLVYKLYMFDLETLYSTNGDFCSLLITFANSLNPDQERQTRNDKTSVLMWIQAVMHSDSLHGGIV